MAYKLNITKRADKLIDKLIYHLLYRLNSKQAAEHFLNGLENIYDRLEQNPFQFPLSKDSYLANRDYHEAIVPQMDYIVVFNINTDIVNIVGVFHQLENYRKKI